MAWWLETPKIFIIFPLGYILKLYIVIWDIYMMIPKDQIVRKYIKTDIIKNVIIKWTTFLVFSFTKYVTFPRCRTSVKWNCSLKQFKRNYTQILALFNTGCANVVWNHKLILQLAKCRHRKPLMGICTTFMDLRYYVWTVDLNNSVRKKDQQILICSHMRAGASRNLELY